MSDIYFAGGCFWGIEKYFQQIRGVISTEVGYANGDKENPTYEQVCKDNTGFAETVHVEYDTETITLSFLLDLFYKAVDPVAVNRQGNDVGSQYRTGIYYVEKEDVPEIEASLRKLGTHFDEPIAIEINQLHNFYKAEEYHQKYLDHNPSGYCHIGKKLFQEAREANPVD